MKERDFDWRPLGPASVNARRELPKLLASYFAAGRKLNQRSPASALHDFRLRTKHLRYTLEVFLPLYGPVLESRINSLRPIQNALGERNDCEVFLSDFKSRAPAAARAFVKKRAAEKHREFLRYWREEFDADGEERKWTQYLTRFARTKPTR
jgi:CHAD domain-containing protein